MYLCCFLSAKSSLITGLYTAVSNLFVNSNTHDETFGMQREKCFLAYLQVLISLKPRNNFHFVLPLISPFLIIKLSQTMSILLSDYIY